MSKNSSQEKNTTDFMKKNKQNLSKLGPNQTNLTKNVNLKKSITTNMTKNTNKTALTKKGNMKKSITTNLTKQTIGTNLTKKGTVKKKVSIAKNEKDSNYNSVSYD